MKFKIKKVNKSFDLQRFFLYLILLLVYGGDSQEAPKKTPAIKPEFFFGYFPYFSKSLLNLL